MNNLLRNFKHFDKCYSKDQIPLIKNNKSLIFNLQNSDQKGSHGYLYLEKIITYLYLIVLVLEIS